MLLEGSEEGRVERFFYCVFLYSLFILTSIVFERWKEEAKEV